MKNTLLFLLFVGLVSWEGQAFSAAPQTQQPPPPGDRSMTVQEKTLPRATRQLIEQRFGKTQAFEPDRTAEALLSRCARWAIPDAPDEASRRWYRAATTLHSAVKYRTVEEHHKVLMLYEGAARRGHYRAIKDLTILYTEGRLVRGGRFRPEPQKARAWIDYGLSQGWVGAIEWVADAVGSGTARFEMDQQLSLDLMQQASDQGVSLAQYRLALHYGNRLKQVEKEEALLQCAAAQDLNAALHDWGVYQRHDHPKEALELYQRAIMAGGEKGGDTAERTFARCCPSLPAAGIQGFCAYAAARGAEAMPKIRTRDKAKTATSAMATSGAHHVAL